MDAQDSFRNGAVGDGQIKGIDAGSDAGHPRVTRQLNVLSLFSGVGGIDLGLERAGLNVIGQVEINPWARSILAKHWPDVPQHDDVRTVAKWWNSREVVPMEAATIDVIAGGFPRSMPRHIECWAA